MLLWQVFVHSVWGGFVILRRYGWGYYQRDGQPNWNPHFVGVFPFLCLCRGGAGGWSRDDKSAYVCFEAIFFRNYIFWYVFQETYLENISYISIYDIYVYICGWRQMKHKFPPCSCKCECQPFVGFGEALYMKILPFLGGVLDEQNQSEPKQEWTMWFLWSEKCNKSYIELYCGWLCLAAKSSLQQEKANIHGNPQPSFLGVRTYILGV